MRTQDLTYATIYKQMLVKNKMVAAATNAAAANSTPDIGLEAANPAAIPAAAMDSTEVNL